MLAPLFQAIDDWLQSDSVPAVAAVAAVVVAAALCVAAAALWLLRGRVLGCAPPRKPLPPWLRGAVVTAGVAAVLQVHTALQDACPFLVAEPVLPPGGLHAVPEVPAHMTHATLVSFKERGLPVVARGALPPGDLAPWELPALAATFGGVPVSYQLGNVEQQATQLRSATFGEFVATLGNATAGAAPYLAEAPDLLPRDGPYAGHVDRVFRRFLLPDKPWLPAVSVMQYLWVGPAGAATGLHADFDPTNVLCQMVGTKTLTLFSPYDTPRLYPSSKYDHGALLSDVNPFDVDAARFPDYAAATPLPVVLSPGDCVYVPAGWFHFAQSHSTSVSLTGRTYTVCEGLSFLPTVLLRGLHALGLYARGHCTCHSAAA